MPSRPRAFGLRVPAAAELSLALGGYFVLISRLPLIGAAWMGHPAAAFEYPLDPPGFVQHAPFSWPHFLAATAVCGAALAPFVVAFLRAGIAPRAPRPVPGGAWPRWTGPAVALVAASWWLSWTSVEAVQPARIYAFTPLWVGFILVVSAWTERRGGAALHARPRAAEIVVLSAAFWWVFEYLNRFTENWVYTGTPLEGPLSYLLQGTLPFAVVLPAVAAVQGLLATCPRLDAAFRAFGPSWGPPPPVARALGAGVIVTASFGLAGLSVWPNVLFPLPWLSPLAILLGFAAVRGRRHPLSGVADGDWRAAVTWGLAGLVCGFFWEMWNIHSLARWTYVVPYVGAPKLFEMPLLGYLGYVPFGVECALVAALVGYHAPVGPPPARPADERAT